MANGDLANTSGVFTPVSSGAEYRLGYDDINRLADAAARIGGASAWAVAGAITPNTGGGLGSASDPTGGTTGALVGGVKTLGPLLATAAFHLIYTGATITAPTNGNITDLLLATLSAPYRPAARRQLRAIEVNGNWEGPVRLQSDGGLVLTSVTPNAVIANPTTIYVEGYYPL